MGSTDLVLLDIKHIDDAKHRILTGHTNENILDCARYLSYIGKPVWIRHVLVPGINELSKRKVPVKLAVSLVTADDAVRSGADIHSDNVMGELYQRRLTIGDTDEGVSIRESIRELEQLIDAYRSGDIVQ